MNLGTILECGLSTIKTSENKPDAGLNRLYTILIFESAHLIWRVHCEWHITREERPDKRITPREIKNRWIKHMSQRIHDDLLSTRIKVPHRKSVPTKRVEQTWNRVIKDDNIWRLSLDNISEFLVGMDSGRPPG